MRIWHCLIDAYMTLIGFLHSIRAMPILTEREFYQHFNMVGLSYFGGKKLFWNPSKVRSLVLALLRG